MTREEINRRTGFIDSPAIVKSYPWRTVNFGRAIKWARKQAKRLIKPKEPTK